jgi:hypothetical protein
MSEPILEKNSLHEQTEFHRNFSRSLKNMKIPGAIRRPNQFPI